MHTVNNTEHFVYALHCNYVLNSFTCVGLVPAAVAKSSSTVMDNYSPEMQQNILIVSQPSSVVSIVSDTHTTTGPVTTRSVVACLTTCGSEVTSISGQHVSTITTAGVYVLLSCCVATYKCTQT